MRVVGSSHASLVGALYHTLSHLPGDIMTRSGVKHALVRFSTLFRDSHPIFSGFVVLGTEAQGGVLTMA